MPNATRSAASGLLSVQSYASWLVSSWFVYCVILSFAVALSYPVQAQQNEALQSKALLGDSESRITSVIKEAHLFVLESCRQWSALGGAAHSKLLGSFIEQTELKQRQQVIGQSFKWASKPANGVTLEVLQEPQRFTLQLGQVRPWLLLVLGPDCALQHARQIVYNAQAQPYKVLVLDKTLRSSGQIEWINPALAQSAELASLPRVALLDSGVNYLLPHISQRLATDSKGISLSYDYWDMDAQPFDAHPTASVFFNARHGTRTASIFLAEAPDIPLVSYRYPRPDMTRMRLMVKHAAANGVSIIGMPLGGNRKQEWVEFYQAAREHPELLFVVSAGNNGRDLSQSPVYPAALSLENMVVVTSADDAVRPAERTNWGREHVHYMLPAENLPTIDFDGSQTRVSGSSYAVARLTAMLARLKAVRPQMNAADMLHELRRRYSDGAHPRYVSEGYIADPLAAFADMENRELVSLVSSTSLASASTTPDIEQPAAAAYRFDPIFYVVDSRWTDEQVQQLNSAMSATLAQCNIAVGQAWLRRLVAEDYLLDMQVGTSKTMVDAVKAQELKGDFRQSTARIFLIRKTREIQANGESFRYDAEAFGRGNTRSRAWLRDSVWLSYGVQDADLAVSHEMMHVLMNSGRHSDIKGNLMNSFTAANNTRLTVAQCQNAIDAGRAHGLLEPVH